MVAMEIRCCYYGNIFNGQPFEVSMCSIPWLAQLAAHSLTIGFSKKCDNVETDL